MHKKIVGVLALQGDFIAHQRVLERIGAAVIQIRTVEQLTEIDGLVIPGGESTTMLKLLNNMHFKEPLRQFALEKPIFGTCAGVILMAKTVLNPSQDSLSIIDLTVERNAYGRQLNSHIAWIQPDDIEAIFIRAPIIQHTGPNVRVLIEHNGHPILVEEGKHLAATFHPELTENCHIHQLFLNKL